MSFSNLKQDGGWGGRVISEMMVISYIVWNKIHRMDQFYKNILHMFIQVRKKNPKQLQMVSLLKRKTLSWEEKKNLIQIASGCLMTAEILQKIAKDDNS